MANGQTGFQQRRAGAPMGQLQRAGQMGMAGPPQVPNPNAVPPPGAVDINAKNRIPPGLMRFLNRGGMLPNPNAMPPPGMVPGQPQPQMNQFAPGVPGGLPDPNAVAPVGLQQFPGGQLPRMPIAPEGGIPMRQPVAMGGSFLGAPGIASRGPLVAEGPMPQAAVGILPSAGGIPAGQGGIPRNLLNLAMRRTGFMPQAFGQYGP